MTNIMVYVIDTNCLIYYFYEVFGGEDLLSSQTRKIIDQSFDEESDVRLSIPSIVFVEIFDNFYDDEQCAAKIRWEVLEPIMHAPIEIREIDQEVIENMMRIKGRLDSHEIHDKLILASAICLQCPLITVDPQIIKYVEETGIIPRVLN